MTKKFPIQSAAFIVSASLICLAFTKASADKPNALASVDVETLHSEQHGEPTERELLRLDERPYRSSGFDVGPSDSVSVGSPNSGKLTDGVPIANARDRQIKIGSKNSIHGTAELVRLIEFAAAAVAHKFPRAELTIGDLSREGGGRLRPHKSHRSGRDADLGFYLRNRRGRKINVRSFIDIARNGVGRQYGRIYKFDAPRNWELVKALLSHPTIDVQHIFAANSVQRALYRHASKKKSNRRAIRRAKRVLHQMSRGSPHRSHFHVRVFCSEDDRPECKDAPPYFPWHRRPPDILDTDLQPDGEQAQR